MQGLPFLLLLFFVGFVSSFIGNFVNGGTSLIGITSMLALGIPPHLAIATQAIGAFGWRVGGLREFLRAKKIIWKFVIPLSIIAFIGSSIGAHILISTNEQLLNEVIAAIIVLLIPLTFIKKNWGVKKEKLSNKKEIMGYVFYFIMSIWYGFFLLELVFFSCTFICFFLD